MDFGIALRHERKRHGYTQKQLAKATQTSINTISNIENGRYYPSIALLKAICGVYGYSLDFLMLQAMDDDVAGGKTLRPLVC